MVAIVPYSINFASRSKKNHDVTEAQIANKFVFSDFYIAPVCNLGFAISGSHIEQVWPRLVYINNENRHIVICKHQHSSSHVTTNRDT